MGGGGGGGQVIFHVVSRGSWDLNFVRRGGGVIQKGLGQFPIQSAQIWQPLARIMHNWQL